MIQPRLVRLDGVRSDIGRASVRGPVPQVDDPAVVELGLVAAESLGDVVVPVPADEPEVALRVEPTAVVLGEALARVPRLGQVAPLPERPQPPHAGRPAVERIERRALPGRRNPREVLAVQRHGRGRGARLRPGDVGAIALSRPVAEVQRPRLFQQPDAGVAPEHEIGLERRERRVRVAGRALHAAPRQLDCGRSSRPGGRRFSRRAQREVKPRGDALRQRCAREVDRRLGVGGIGLHRLRERARRFGQVILPQDLPQVLEADDRVLAEGELGEPVPVPGIRPLRTQLGRPLELARRVVEVRLARDLAQPVRDEAEPEVNERIVAVALGDADRRRLEPLEADAVGRTAERIAQAVERRALGRALRADASDERDERQWEERGPHANHGRHFHYTTAAVGLSSREFVQ